jgi:hypothetical protein
MNDKVYHDNKRYIITRIDGTPVEKGCWFILRLDTDEHARIAALAYAKSIQPENPELATDLIERVSDYGIAAQMKKLGGT